MYDISNILIDLKSSIKTINSELELVGLQIAALDERITKLEPTKKEDDK